MTKTNTADSTTPAATSSQGAQGFCPMSQLNNGPAALLYSLSNELIQIYNELEDSYNKMTKAEVQVQKNTITVGAQAQRDTASAEANGYWCQMGATIAGAVATGVSVYFETKNNTESNIKLSTQEGELNQLKALEKTTPPRPNVNSGNTPGAPAPAVELNDRARLMKGGTLLHDGEANEDQVAITAKNQEAINSMKSEDSEDYKQFRSKLQDKIREKELEINSTNLQRNSTQTAIQQKSSMATTIFNGAGQGLQAHYKADSGQHQASQQIDSGVNSMANGTADSTRSNIGQNYAKVSEVISSARQGAQTYAQT